MTSLSTSKPEQRGDPHGWNAIQNYLKVHHRYLDDRRDHVVVSDDLQYTFTGEDRFEIRGRIHCHHGLFIDVEKTLEINARDQVRTVRYSYDAGVSGRTDRPIFRYDNAHLYAREGHPDKHHRHRYDTVTWDETGSPEWVGRTRWPHLSQVIDELWEWWENGGSVLDIP